ncbi:hypothetical protein MPSEU_000116000 [Mayamaea pseudoterrestris]|nr:hypothetical protein MPSEU_000116000 [Mayamaea pseudoterrestris]
MRNKLWNGLLIFLHFLSSGKAFAPALTVNERCRLERKAPFHHGYYSVSPSSDSMEEIKLREMEQEKSEDEIQSLEDDIHEELVASTASSLNADIRSNLDTTLQSTSKSSIFSSDQPISNNNMNTFDLSTALLCAGLAFDAYVEPPANSTRWERGSKGLNVAFLSQAFTRNLYQGLVEVTLQKCTGLPEDESTVERILSGNGVDAKLLAAIIEGSWQEDLELLEREQYHQGILDMTGAAHVGYSSTAWANVDEKQSQVAKRQRGKQSPYHVPGGWGRGGQAIWPEPEPFYLYVQNPAEARLVLTVMDAARVGDGSAVGSTHKKLTDLIPHAKLRPEELIDSAKKEILKQIAEGKIEALDDTSKILMGAHAWEGSLPLTSKPRKKDKNSQIMAGAAAGAFAAGPVGAAAGALIGSFYEGQVQGRVELKLRYLPIPPVKVQRKRYRVKGGMPGINWGDLSERHWKRSNQAAGHPLNDLEHCFFINHDSTGCTCAVYRSVETKLIVVSFRGTCQPIDLLTDASVVQDAWVEGDDINEQDFPKVHAGFRNSLNSVARRLKGLLLATVDSGEHISDYDMLVTGHSLGGALATLFVADIAEYGIDAGRGLPQLEPAEPWWKFIADTVAGREARKDEALEPPRPKTLRLYSFGSPRVGNKAFAELFDALLAEKFINQAYRVVNDEDVVARLPRSINALVFGYINYEHCGPTVLISQPKDSADSSAPLVWVEGESDDSQCPVRDGVALTSPMAEGSLLGDLFRATEEELKNAAADKQESLLGRLASFSDKLSKRLPTLTPGDIASVFGIERSFSDREMKLISSLVQGRGLAHHLEDQYYGGLGRAGSYLCVVGEDIVEVEI